MRSSHPPRILLLYGSLRERSFSRLLVEEAARLLQAMGAETQIFCPSGLPLPDDAPESHPKVQELRALTLWAAGMVWYARGIGRSACKAGELTQSHLSARAGTAAKWLTLCLPLGKSKHKRAA